MRGSHVKHFHVLLSAVRQDKCICFILGLSGSKVLKYKIAISQNNDCNCFCIKTLKLLHEKYKILDVGYAAEISMMEDTEEKSC